MQILRLSCSGENNLRLSISWLASVIFFSAFSISALTKLTACFSTSSAILWLYLASRHRLPLKFLRTISFVSRCLLPCIHSLSLRCFPYLLTILYTPLRILSTLILTALIFPLYNRRKSFL